MEGFLKLGLFCWLPIEENKKILCIGCPREMEEDFQSRYHQVKVTEDIEKISPGETFDYIFISDGDYLLCKGASYGKSLKKMLTKTGHLLFACHNRLGLRYFVGDRDPYTKQVLDGIENYWSYTEKDFAEFKGRCFARDEIEQYVRELGFSENQYRGYSIFPGLEMPQLFYAWNYTPKEILETRYTPVYEDGKSIFLQETKLCDSLIKNQMFHPMANAYLIDCSLEDDFYEFHQLTISMERGRESATATVLQKNNQVVKKVLYPEANVSMERLQANTMALKEKEIPVVDMKKTVCGCYQGTYLQGLEMEYVKAPLAMEYLQRLLAEDSALFKKEVCRFLDIVLQSGEEMQEEVSELGPIYDKVYFDMVPINCFYQDKEFVFFDQEYVIEKYPIYVVLVRVLDFLYTKEKALQKNVPIEYFLDKYHLSEKLDTYRAMSQKFLYQLKKGEKLQDFHQKHIATTDGMNQNRQKMNGSAEEYVRKHIRILDGLQNKKLYIFGTGMWAKKFIACYGEHVSIAGFLDNDKKLWGAFVENLPVENPDILRQQNPENYKVIICVKQYGAILKQLKEIGIKHYGFFNPNVDIMMPETVACMDGAVQEDKIKQQDTGKEKKKYHLGYVSGVFDLFHIGHLNLLKRAKEQCDILLVGVVSDEQATAGKAKRPYISQEERCEIVQACRYVDQAFVLPVAAAGGRDVFKKYHYDVLFSGDDNATDPYWQQERNWLQERGADIVFFPYTQSISSTKIKNEIS